METMIYESLEWLISRKGHYEMDDNCQELIDVAISTMRKYQTMQADYENRLKADMLSMLYKLRSEIINMPKYFPYADHTRRFIDGDIVVELIDNEIDALRENEDGKID